MFLSSLLTILALCAVYGLAAIPAVQNRKWKHRTLSFAAGIGVSYVFLDLLPDLSQRQAELDQSIAVSILNRHVYILALVGLVSAFWVETASRESRKRQRELGRPDRTENPVYRLSMVSGFIQHLAIGYAVGSPGDKAVEPLWLFALALGLHFLINDHALVEHHGDRYKDSGRILQVAALLAGWLIGVIESIAIPGLVLTLALAYIAGGTVLNIIRHELPETKRSSDAFAFAAGAAFYTLLLLLIH